MDPLTGAQLNTRQDDKLTLQDATGAQRLLLFDGALTMTPHSVQAVVNLDSTGRTEFMWFQVIAPAVLGLVGIAALITGIVLARLRREEDHDHADSAAPEPVPAP